MSDTLPWTPNATNALKAGFSFVATQLGSHITDSNFAIVLGTYWTPQHSTCQPCPSRAGPVGATDVNQCVNCTWPSIATDGVCYTCPPGTVANDDRTSCDGCPPNTLVINNTCSKCDGVLSNYFDCQCPWNYGLELTPNPHCVECGLGGFLRNKKCTYCGVGSYLNAELNFCDFCIPGKFRTVLEQAECQPCQGSCPHNTILDVACSAATDQQCIGGESQSWIQESLTILNVFCRVSTAHLGVSFAV
jgi:hypothetical protein